MKRSILFLFCFTLLSLFSIQPALAGDVVLNEFLVDPDADQWVELYNKGNQPVDISGWFIDDEGGTQKFTIPTGTIIDPSEFEVFKSGLFNFDRTNEDTAKLLNGTSIEDSYTYSSGPGAGNSFGRDVDGVGNWVIFDTPTKGSSNNSSTPLPSPTPTPSPSPTPTPTPKPTATPKPTPTTKPTATPKASQTSGSTAGESAYSQISPTGPQPRKRETTERGGEVLSATESPSINLELPSSTEGSSPSGIEEGGKQSIVRLIMIVAGILLIASGILFTIWKRRSQG